MDRPSFREHQNFSVQPAELSRQVGDLEDNVRDALNQAADGALGLLVPTNLKTAAYSAMLGELVVASGTFLVTLPVASPQNAGAVVGIVVTTAGTISVASASGLVQGVATDALSATGLFLYESNGVGWWRSPGMVSRVTAGAGLTGGGTGDVTLAVGTISSANVDSSIVTTAAMRKARTELQYIRLLLMQLVELEEAS